MKRTEPLSPAVIRACRAGLRLSQRQLGALAGIHQKSVAYWEANDARKVTHPENGGMAKLNAAFQEAGIRIKAGAIRLPD